jgi:RNA-binding protein YhbY
MKIQIGKNGVTEGVLEHIKKASRNTEHIKIKFLPSYAKGNDVEQAAETISNYLEPLYEATYVVIGNTAEFQVQRS